MNDIKSLIKRVSQNVAKDTNIQPSKPIETIEDLHDYLHYECRMGNIEKGQIWFDMLSFLDKTV